MRPSAAWTSSSGSSPTGGSSRRLRARWACYTGAPPAFNAAENAKNTAKQNAERSQAWADSLISHLQDGIDTIQSDYIDHVEDEAATVADPEIKSLIDTYGSEAVANALVDYADANGNLGPDFRIVGHGAERKLALR